MNILAAVALAAATLIPTGAPASPVCTFHFESTTTIVDDGAVTKSTMVDDCAGQTTYETTITRGGVTITTTVIVPEFINQQKGNHP